MRTRFEAFCDLFYRQKRVRVGDAVEAIVIDVFRHGSGGIVEHWDVKAELGLQQRQHYFDGLTPRGR